MSPFDLTMACVAAMASNDRENINSLNDQFSKLTPLQIFGALGDFGQLINSGLKPEQRDLMREVIRREVASQPLSASSQSTAVALAGALLVDADGQKFAVEFAVEFADRSEAIGGDVSNVVMGCLMATSSVVMELDIKLNFN